MRKTWLLIETANPLPCTFARASARDMASSGRSAAIIPTLRVWVAARKGDWRSWLMALRPFRSNIETAVQFDTPVDGVRRPKPQSYGQKQVWMSGSRSSQSKSAGSKPEGASSRYPGQKRGKAGKRTLYCPQNGACCMEALEFVARLRQSIGKGCSARGGRTRHPVNRGHCR